MKLTTTIILILVAFLMGIAMGITIEDSEPITKESCLEECKDKINELIQNKYIQLAVMKNKTIEVIDIK